MGMSNEKILEVLARYEDVIEARLKVGYAEDARFERLSEMIKEARLKHLAEMIPKIRVFLVEDRREKAFRWLGFLQGALWLLGIYTIEEMADHSRPADEPFRADAVGTDAVARANKKD